MTWGDGTDWCSRHVGYTADDVVVTVAVDVRMAVQCNIPLQRVGRPVGVDAAATDGGLVKGRVRVRVHNCS